MYENKASIRWIDCSPNSINMQPIEVHLNYASLFATALPVQDGLCRAISCAHATQGGPRAFTHSPRRWLGSTPTYSYAVLVGNFTKYTSATGGACPPRVNAISNNSQVVQRSGSLGTCSWSTVRVGNATCALWRALPLESCAHPCEHATSKTCPLVCAC